MSSHAKLRLAMNFRLLGLLSIPFFLLGIPHSYAVESDNVTISCDDVTLPAAQLMYLGKEVDEDRASVLKKEKKIDISFLDPKPSDIWFPKYAGTPPTDSTPNVIFPLPGETVAFDSNEDSRNFYRGKVKSRNGNLLLNVALTSQETLLLHALLKQLDYRVEPLKWYPKLKVQFRSLEQLIAFKNDIADRNGVSKPIEREEENGKEWFVEEDKENHFLILKDVILESARITDIRYAWGEIDSDRIGQNRASRALIVLYSLLNLNSRTRSLNLFSWEATSKFNEGLLFEHPNAGRFFQRTDCDDVRWITRKIAALPLDFWEKLANIPGFKNRELNQLLLYKLLSRRDTLVERVSTVFSKKIEWAVPPRANAYKVQEAAPVIPANLDQNDPAIQALLVQKLFPYIPFNRKFTSNPISIGEGRPQSIVKNGKISPFFKLDECCVMTLVAGELKSPLRWEEVKHLAWNEAINAGIGELTSRINEKLILGDPVGSLEKQNLDYEISQGERLKDYVLETGSQNGFTRQIKAWSVLFGPFYIQVNREVTSGTYYGSKAQAQLVDTVAVGLSPSWRQGVFGKATLAPLSGTQSVSFTHVFTHVRPIKNLADIKDEKKLKTALEPKVFHHIRKVLQTKIGINDKAMTDEDVQTILTDFFSTFLEGEVLTISNGWGGKIGVQHTFGLASVLGPWSVVLNPSLAVGLSTDQTFSHQVTFNRDGKTLQIYDSSLRPKKVSALLGLGIFPKFLKSGFNLASAAYTAKSGFMETKTIAVDLSPYLPDANQQIVSTPEERLKLLRNLQKVFTENDTEKLKEIGSANQLKHQLRGSALNLSLLGLVRGRFKDGRKTEVVFSENPEYPNQTLRQRTINLFSQRIVHINGFDPYGLFGKVLNSSLGTGSVGPRGENPNPSGTFLGKSHMKGVQVDADLTPRPINEYLTPEENTPFQRVGFFNEAYSGTIMSGNKLRQILDRFSEKYKNLNNGQPIYTEANFANITSNQTYDIRSRIMFYSSGIRKIENLFDPSTPEMDRNLLLEGLSDSPVEALSETWNWVKEANLLASRKQRPERGIWFYNLFNLFQRKATDDSEKDQIHQIQWLTRVLELLNRNTNLGNFLQYIGKEHQNFAVLINGKRVGAEDGNEGVILNPSGTQNQDRLPISDVNFEFYSPTQDGKPVRFKIGGTVWEPSVSLGGF
jgi:hypothetical protein